jgi:hypothetical protein
MPASIQELFQHTYLTEMVQRIKPGLPKVLPDEFYAVSGPPVTGDRVAMPMSEGARDVPKVLPYMSPARQAGKYTLSLKNVVLLWLAEVMPFGKELMTIYRQFSSYAPQDNRAGDLLRFQCEQLRQKFDNFRVAAVNSVFARDGKIYIDSDGNLLPTSSGADYTFDNGVPAGNSGTFGGILSTWNTSADIPSQVNNFKAYALKQTNWPIATAVYGQGVSGRLAVNTAFQAYLARNPNYNSHYINTGEIADGVLGLKWVKAQDAYFVDQNGTAQTQFRTDYITFCPDLKGTYKLLEGTTPVPKDGTMAAQGDVEAALRSMVEVPGIGSYAYVTFNPIQLHQFMFDCVAPVLAAPDSYYWGNVG